MESGYLLFFKFIILGGIVSACYGIFKGVVFVFKQNIVIQIICDLLFSAFCGLAFMYCINAFNNGEIRLFLLLGMAFGMFLYNKTFGKIFAKVGNMLYNYVIKILGKFASTKFGKALFK